MPLILISPVPHPAGRPLRKVSLGYGGTAVASGVAKTTEGMRKERSEVKELVKSKSV